jgi:hypothetical protein
MASFQSSVESKYTYIIKFEETKLESEKLSNSWMHTHVSKDDSFAAVAIWDANVVPKLECNIKRK